MSGRMNIRFTRDMPPAAVEVVSPDLSIVERLWLAPGEQKSVDVPSEASFLRIHLGSGEVVTLGDPGSLDRIIDVSDLRSRRGPRKQTLPSGMRVSSRRQLRQRLADATVELPVMAPSGSVSLLAKLDGGLQIELDPPQTGTVFDKGAAVLFTPPMSKDRYVLRMQMPPDMRVQIRLPGSSKEVLVRSDAIGEERRVASVRVKTGNATADAIGGYMRRGDLYSAMSMASWAEQAEQMLMMKRSDPFAAAVGAYLLLRTRRIDLLHDWTKNLLGWFPNFSDAIVIRAWHLVYRRGSESEIRDLFLNAINSPLPVFTEGLRLLSEGIRLLGQDSSVGVETLDQHARHALSHAPFTTTVERNDVGATPLFDVDIDYASRV